MFNTTVNSDADVIKYGRLLVDKGAQSVIVSLGGDGAIYIDKEISIKAVNPQGKWLIQLALVIVQLQAWWLELLQVYRLKKHFNKQSHAVLPRHLMRT